MYKLDISIVNLFSDEIKWNYYRKGGRNLMTQRSVRILDIDMDFFLNNIAHFQTGNNRLSDDDF